MGQVNTLYQLGALLEWNIYQGFTFVVTGGRCLEGQMCKAVTHMVG